jgi:hypothetical protein
MDEIGILRKEEEKQCHHHAFTLKPNGKLEDKKGDAWWAGNSPFIPLHTEKEG